MAAATVNISVRTEQLDNLRTNMAVLREMIEKLSADMELLTTDEPIRPTHSRIANNGEPQGRSMATEAKYQFTREQLRDLLTDAINLYAEYLLKYLPDGMDNDEAPEYARYSAIQCVFEAMDAETELLADGARLRPTHARIAVEGNDDAIDGHVHVALQMSAAFLIGDETSSQETIQSLYALAGRLNTHLKTFSPRCGLYVVITAASDQLFVDVQDDGAGSTNTIRVGDTLAQLIEQEEVIKSVLAQYVERYAVDTDSTDTITEALGR